MALLSEPYFANPGPWTYTGDAGHVDRSALFQPNYARLSGVAGQEGGLSQRFRVDAGEVGAYGLMFRVGTDPATVGPLPFSVRVFLDGVEAEWNIAGYTSDSAPNGSNTYGEGAVRWPGYTSLPQKIHMAAGIHTLRVQALSRSDATNPARHIRYHYIDFLSEAGAGDSIPGAVIEYGLRFTYAPGGGTTHWLLRGGAGGRITYHAE